MPPRPTTDAADVVPGDAPTDTAYERDFYSWSLEQARLVREGRWDAVDRDNVAEEIESLGREQFSKLESALRVLLVHILKWDHQPGTAGSQLDAVDRAAATRSRMYCATTPD